jgi:hypothetical protein
VVKVSLNAFNIFSFTSDGAGAAIATKPVSKKAR